MDEDSESDTVDGFTEQSTAWDTVLEPQEVPPSTSSGRHLCRLLGSAPPLGALAHQNDGGRPPRYVGVPRTVPPRKNRIDRDLWQAQWKLERAMHEMVTAMKLDDKSPMIRAAACIRSSWKDLHQQRRRLLAGKATYQLEARADEDRPRLLSKDEEAKIRRPRGPRREIHGGAHRANHGADNLANGVMAHGGPGIGPHLGAKGRGKARGPNMAKAVKSDGAQVQGPRMGLGSPLVGNPLPHSPQQHATQPSRRH